MALAVASASAPAQVIISGGVAGPAGVGVAAASVDASNNLLLTLTDGTALAPLSLTTALEQMIGTAVVSALEGGRLATLDATGRLVLGGAPMLAADASGRLVFVAVLPSTDAGYIPVAGSGVIYSNGGMLCVA